MVGRDRWLIAGLGYSGQAVARAALRDGASVTATARDPAARAAPPRGAFAQGTTVPEVKKATRGYLALTDSAPLIIAKEKGLFAKHGMPEVEVAKQASWGATRDNLVLGGGAGGIDGAHILTPMPYLMTAGRITQNSQPVPMVITARLNTNGQAISVAEKHKALGARLDAAPLKKVLTPESKMAVTFRGGTHDLWMRYWLAAAGIDPDKDVQTIVVPPPQMVANMKVGTMDAFCVGEPWNDQLVHQSMGYTACITGEIWQDHPEKSLGVRADWVAKNPKAAVALTAAVIEAQIWCEEQANKEEMAAILGKRAWEAWKAQRYREALVWLDRRATFAPETRDLMQLRAMALDKTGQGDAARAIEAQLDAQLGR